MPQLLFLPDRVKSNIAVDINVCFPVSTIKTERPAGHRVVLGSTRRQKVSASTVNADCAVYLTYAKPLSILFLLSNTRHPWRQYYWVNSCTRKFGLGFRVYPRKGLLTSSMYIVASHLAFMEIRAMT